LDHFWVREANFFVTSNSALTLILRRPIPEARNKMSVIDFWNTDLATFPENLAKNVPNSKTGQAGFAVPAKPHKPLMVFTLFALL